MSSDPSQLNNEEDRLILVIKEEQVTVAPENQVKIHVAVINQGPNEDYVEITVKGVPSDWTTLDTPVVRLAGGEAKQVTLTVQPPPVPQSRVGRYPLDVRAVSQDNPSRSVTARSYLAVAAYESRGLIGVMLGSVHFSIAPGSSITVPVLLQNRSPVEDNLRLNIEGLPANWISTSATYTKLEPSKSKEVQFTIRAPRSPEADAGRTPFKIIFTSQEHPDQIAEVECILTVAAFWQFSASLQPDILEAEQPAQLVITNEGNTVDAYSIDFQSSGSLLAFEKAVQVARRGSPAEPQQVEIGYIEIPPGERVQVAPGQRGLYEFRSRLRSRPIVGNERAYPFTVIVQSSENKSSEFQGQVNEKGYLPTWLVSTLVIGFLIFCLVLIVPVSALRRSAQATQTAAFSLTQAALSGQDDPDSDGLINTEEGQLGTDPLTADTDVDGLLDGEEVKTYLTDPLNPDHDADGLLDGQEVHTAKTDPLKADTDGDLLNDGDEVERKTVPVDPDTDKDGLNDGAEVELGSDPLQQDTDKDGLLDSQENQTCPRPVEPDSDKDGIIDGTDLDPCNPANPALTATGVAGIPTPANSPTPIPTGVFTSTPVPTSPGAATLTPAPPSLQGVMVFASNRDGNSEIYALNLANQATTRLTNSPAQDMQAALAPDSVQVAYVTNQDGNNEIYLAGLDSRTPLNLSNNPGDDQQPTWSPDGNWVAFTSNRDGNQEIYVVRSDGTGLRNLTGNPANDFAPTWFSSGGILGSQDWLAFTSTRDGNQEVYKVKPDGSELTNLTQNPANDYSPAGFRSGAMLAFVSERDGNPEIYTMTDTGGATTNLTNNSAQDLDPTMNANGSWVAFSSDREGNLEIYAVRVSGGAAYNLTRNAGQDRHPDW